MVTLCMHKGPSYTIEQVLETEEQIREFCGYLDIEVESIDDRRSLIEKVVSHFVNYPPRCVGFANVLRYIELIKRSGSSDNWSKAFDCFKKIEFLLLDIYRLYIGEILFKYLSASDKEAVLNTLKQDSPKFRSIIDQLIKYENIIIKGEYKEFQNEIAILNGQDSIFGGSKPEHLVKISDIRNKYFGHGNDISPTIMKAKSKEFFDISEQFIKESALYLPRVIIPISHTINEWGFQVVTYIDEDNVNEEGYLDDFAQDTHTHFYSERFRRFYWFEKRGEFYPYQRAYCLHPHRASLMRDPKLYYATYLRDIGNRPVER